GHSVEANKDRWKAIVMGFCKELFCVGRQNRFLLTDVCDAHRNDTGIWHARFLGCDAFIPRPNESFWLSLVEDRESKTLARFFRIGERQRDATNVSLSCHQRIGVSIEPPFF